MEPSSLAITAGAWAWGKYSKSLTDKTAGTVKSKLEKFGWSDAAKAYRAKIKKLYGTMQIMGMAKRGRGVVGVRRREVGMGCVGVVAGHLVG